MVVFFEKLSISMILKKNALKNLSLWLARYIRYVSYFLEKKSLKCFNIFKLKPFKLFLLHNSVVHSTAVIIFQMIPCSYFAKKAILFCNREKIFHEFTHVNFILLAKLKCNIWQHMVDKPTTIFVHGYSGHL